MIGWFKALAGQKFDNRRQAIEARITRKYKQGVGRSSHSGLSSNIVQPPSVAGPVYTAPRTRE